MRYIVVVDYPKKVENERIGQMVTRGNGLEVKSIISEQQLPQIADSLIESCCIEGVRNSGGSFRIIDNDSKLTKAVTIAISQAFER